jgi:hypothetical protein
MSDRRFLVLLRVHARKAWDKEMLPVVLKDQTNPVATRRQPWMAKIPLLIFTIPLRGLHSPS